MVILQILKIRNLKGISLLITLYNAFYFCALSPRPIYFADFFSFTSTGTTLAEDTKYMSSELLQ
jgi:hypothetical protein